MCGRDLVSPLLLNLLEKFCKNLAFLGQVLLRCGSSLIESRTVLLVTYLRVASLT